jgi:hypothetical protein
VNSAIDELVPARLRGRVDLAVSGTCWLGAALGAYMTLVLVGTSWIPRQLAWRAVFLLGAVLGACILFLRRHVPESPRWLLLHGRVGEAEVAASAIEEAVGRSRSVPATVTPPSLPRVVIEATGRIRFLSIANVLVRKHGRRTCLGLALMIAQAFAYSGVFFTYALVLGRLYSVPPSRVGAYLNLDFAPSVRRAA